MIYHGFAATSGCRLAARWSPSSRTGQDRSATSRNGHEGLRPLDRGKQL